MKMFRHKQQEFKAIAAERDSQEKLNSNGAALKPHKEALVSE
jgi:hypothetical protein